MIFIRYAQSEKIAKPNNLKGFWSKKPKGLDSQNRQRSLMPEGGEP